MTALADRMQLSNNDYCALTAGILKSAGVNEDQIVLSTATVKRNREKNRKELATEIRDSFAEKTKQEVLAIHWDEKMMIDQQGNNLERLAVLVSCKSKPEGKLLSVFTLEEGCGTGKDNNI